MMTSPSELQRLSELYKLCREVQREHKSRMTPRGKRRRKVRRETSEAKR